MSNEASNLWGKLLTEGSEVLCCFKACSYKASSNTNASSEMDASKQHTSTALSILLDGCFKCRMAKFASFHLYTRVEREGCPVQGLWPGYAPSVLMGNLT